MNLQKIKSHLFPKGFTLVELIVVITILAILGTIGFLSLQGYSASARDSSRIGNLVNLQKGLVLWKVVSGTFPMPENAVVLTASGVPIGYQGFARDQVAEIAKLSPGSTQDPLDAWMYTTYAVSANQTKMQAMAFLENGSRASGIGMAGVDTAWAGGSSYSARTPVSKGDVLGIILSSTGGNVNQPVQELYNVASFTGMDLAKTTSGSGYAMVFSAGDSTATVLMSGTGAYTWSLFTFAYNKRDDLIGNKALAVSDASLVGYWDMETLSGTILKDLSWNGHNIYCRDGAAVLMDCKNRTFVNGKSQGKAIRMSSDWDNYVGGTQKLNLSKNSIMTVVARMSFYDTTVWPLVVPYSGCAASVLLSKVNWFNFWFPCQSLWYDDNSIRMADTLWYGVNVSYSNFKTNTWYDIVTVHTPWLLKFYVNGAKIYDGSDAGWTSTGTLTEPLYIMSGGSKFIVDELSIYNRALSDSEISVLYNATK